ncbi:hypothetical protein CRUP_011139 [Coryphaenoides rupestris]|nr:hypothetical protein CRUP_011139 [Coryphaenoides rupestris]
MQVLQAVRAQLRGAYKGPGGMKLTVLLCMAALLLAAGQRGRAAGSPSPSRTPPRPSGGLLLRRLPLPTLLLRLGERFSIQLHGLHSEPHDPTAAGPTGSDLLLWPRHHHHGPPASPATAAAATVNGALQLQLSRRKVAGEREREEEEDSAEKEKRSDDPPISVDLTFHLLREVLEMARAEQLAQQASDNRRMMDIFGK